MKEVEKENVGNWLNENKQKVMIIDENKLKKA